MKKVISIISIALVALVVGATITLACVKTRTFDAIDALGDYDKIQSVTIYKNGAEYNTLTSYSNKDEISKIVSLHKDSLKDNVLSALFQGATGFDESMDTLSTSKSLSDIYAENICISFKFSEKQTLKWENKNVLNSKEKTVEYDKIIMQLNNSKNFADVTVYVLNDSTSSLYRVNTLAHQADLYDYINNMEYAGNSVA